MPRCHILGQHVLNPVNPFPLHVAPGHATSLGKGPKSRRVLEGLNANTMEEGSRRGGRLRLLSLPSHGFLWPAPPSLLLACSGQRRPGQPPPGSPSLRAGLESSDIFLKLSLCQPGLLAAPARPGSPRAPQPPLLYYSHTQGREPARGAATKTPVS